ncbi:Ankyrin repeat domain-containing protein 16 [Habropoda laboriosa]|uniref:Ankyrin repeat domain-containing protein 16 n=1 Tax=Habropoda laboriosa TaxID=597456 RepID=A0A0L7R7S3_9HYME|nr:PREDICTED: ankyrin repeat domain-containing protein 16-like [Habropoda laboriosa]KOC66925.1 Ankyrin repeat domain-containing protein 16 [Habropoda laboriosa]
MTDSNLSRDFLHACQSGDLSRVETLVSKHNVQDWTLFRHSTSGDTALHVAAREGHLNIVRYLCEAFEKPDFRVDVANKDMKRPLHEAAQFARSDVVKYLIKNGATVDCLKRADWTPLMLACTKTGSEAYECVAALLEANANLFLRNKDGWTPLHMICRSGDRNTFDLLVNQSVQCIEDRSNNGRSAMHIAAFHGHEHLIDRLVALNSNFLGARDSSGSTPLHEAIKAGHLCAAKEIIRLGADVRATDNVGQTILHVAALTGNVEAVKYILEDNLIDVHAEALFHLTPLVAARRSNRKDTIECLIEHGAVK